MTRNAAQSRHAIFAAAAAEFAASGFAGASVDRIAERAGLNKAMIYYHFADKSALYREVVCDIFRSIADRVDWIAGQPLAPAEKIEAAIDGLAAMAAARPYFPAMMAREIAEGGVHLDDQMIGAMLRVFRGVMRLFEEGQAKGAFRPFDPVFMYFTFIAPLIFFMASAPFRLLLKDRLSASRRPDLARFGASVPAGLDAMLAHHKDAIRLVLAASSPTSGRRRRSPRRSAESRAAMRPARPAAATPETRKSRKSARSGDHA